MADWMIWRRKSKDQITPICEDASFTSYLDREDPDGFVHLATPTRPVQPPVENNDYETLYQFMHKMSATNGNRITSATSRYGVPAVYTPPYQPAIINVLPQPSQGSFQNDHVDGTGAFLDGVPFRLASSFNALDYVNQLERDSFKFLRQKTELLERLQYDFKLEKQVISEGDV